MSGLRLLGLYVVTTQLIGCYNSQDTSFGSHRLETGYTLYEGEFLESSCDGEYQLLMQYDGNLVGYDSSGTAFWSSGTAGEGTGPYRLLMQGDNNLVLYDSNNDAYWTSNTDFDGAHDGVYVQMQNDGNIVMYDSVIATLWSSDTHVTVECVDWSQWYDIDNPGGNGDFETVNQVINDYGSYPCGGTVEHTATGVECRQLTTEVDYNDYTYGDVDEHYCTVDNGYICRNGDAFCPDFEIRYCCDSCPTPTPTTSPTPIDCDTKAYCKIYNDPHFLTFDSLYYDFHGVGYFNYVESCNDGDTSILSGLPWVITGKQEACGSVTCIRETIVTVYDSVDLPVSISFPAPLWRSRA